MQAPLDLNKASAQTRSPISTPKSSFLKRIGTKALVFSYLSAAALLPLSSCKDNGKVWKVNSNDKDNVVKINNGVVASNIDQLAQYHLGIGDVFQYGYEIVNPKKIDGTRITVEYTSRQITAYACNLDISAEYTLRSGLQIPNSNFSVEKVDDSTIAVKYQP